MKIAITGAKGLVGRAVVKHCAEKGYHTVQIDRKIEHDNAPNSEHRAADTAGDYDAVVAAFQGCDASSTSPQSPIQ
jgi:nucleoside-diphosphate-sugar epimerase